MITAIKRIYLSVHTVSGIYCMLKTYMSHEVTVHIHVTHSAAGRVENV